MKQKWSEEKIERLEREGRGKGAGADYKPWIQVSDFSSLGKSRRVFSRKTSRVHHLLSDIEWHMFLLLEFSPRVLDIREQFPLPRSETQSLAAERSIKHPIYPGTRIPAVMTTDFLVVSNISGKKSVSAFSCKSQADSDTPRTLEKLELERAYFDNLGVPHHLVFDTVLPRTKIANIEWLRGGSIDTDSAGGHANSDWKRHAERMLYDMQQLRISVSLSEFCANFDERTGVQPGTGLRVARALLWDGQLATDLNQRDLAATPISMFHVTNQTPHGAREA